MAQRQSLTAAQTAALDHVRRRATARQADSDRYIDDALQRASVSLTSGDLQHLMAQVSITINFHPDRVGRDGRTVVEALLRDGLYVNQFRSGISNGGLTNIAGGTRDELERRLFGGAYQADGVEFTSRPIYGGWNLLRHADGACPRFGSCHLRLRPSVSERATFTFGDSVHGPTDVGVLDVPGPVTAALLRSIAADGQALGLRLTDLKAFVDQLISTDESTPGRALDDYIEAQIHGAVDLRGDVEALVVDPSFDGSEIGAALVALARNQDLHLERSPGLKLEPDAVPKDFRGAEIPKLAERVLDHFGDGSQWLNAAILDSAFRSDQGGWTDWGTGADTLQHLKYVWHAMVRFGRTPPE